MAVDIGWFNRTVDAIEAACCMLEYDRLVYMIARLTMHAEQNTQLLKAFRCNQS